MTVHLSGGDILLSGDCPAEDAEVLLGLLIENPGATIDLAQCGSIHTAVVQVLLADRPAIRGVPADPLIAEWVVPQVLDATSETNSRQGEKPCPKRG